MAAWLVLRRRPVLCVVHAPASRRGELWERAASCLVGLMLR